MDNRPVIIYSLPRTQSTAAMQASYKPIKISEPFEPHHLYGKDNETLWKAWHYVSAYNNNIIKTYWPLLLNGLNNKNSVSKIFGYGLYHLSPARTWFNDCDMNQTHKIFVMGRPLKDLVISFFIALLWGFAVEEEVELSEKHVLPNHIFHVQFNIDCFLRFFPKNATLITYDNLPIDYFDYNNVTHKKQQSLDKLKYVSNIDFMMDHVQHIVEYFEPEYNEKINSIPHYR